MVLTTVWLSSRLILEYDDVWLELKVAWVVKINFVCITSDNIPHCVCLLYTVTCTIFGLLG